MRRLLLLCVILLPLSVFAGDFPPGSGGGGGSGDVTTSGSCDDNDLIRANGTSGDSIQCSTIAVDDTGNVTSPADVEGLTVTATPTAGTPGSVVVSEDPDDGTVPGTPQTLTIAISASGISANQTCTVTSTGVSGTSCPFYSVGTYSAAMADFAATNIAADTVIPITAVAGTPVGSSISVDEANEEIDLLSAGTYKVTLTIYAGFALGGTPNECMMFYAWNKTDNAAADMSSYQVYGSGNHTTTNVNRGFTLPGVFYFTIASAKSIEFWTDQCGNGTYPTTNSIGNSIGPSVLVERIL